MLKITSLVLVTLAGCAVHSGEYRGQTPYVVSEGEQVIQPGMASSEVIQRLDQVSILPNGIVKDASHGP